MSISRWLSLCLDCIRADEKKAVALCREVHAKTRRAFGLPVEPPRAREGIKCGICVNECVIPPGQRGYCGIRSNKDGQFSGCSSTVAGLSWYYDPLPTNCVADWVCAGGTGAGYPEYACKDGPERGFYNLAVFFHACSLNCLYCQNWHFREHSLKTAHVQLQELISAADSKTTCICFFGGDPTPQLPFAIRLSRELLKTRKGVFRICWETNGSMNSGLLKEMIDLSLTSGGTIKFDLKAWTESLHYVLTGVTNKRTLENFSTVAERMAERPEPPLLVASTLMVPGYIDEKEIRLIARFIASLNRDIPYTLLAYYPHFYLDDLGFTTREFAMRAVQIAKDEGLRRVRVGNLHLLIN